MKALTPTEHKAQLETFVDFFVSEFKAEVWYLEESARGNIPGREEASMTTLFNVACGLASLLPVPGVALGFIATARVFMAVKSAVDGAGSEITAALGGSGSSVWAAVLENFRDIQDTAGDMVMLRGSSGDGVVEGGKPIDIESLSVLSRWLGYRLAMRYEHLLIERVSLQPEAAIIGLARHAARRSLAYMAQNGGLAGSSQERLDKLLLGVMTSQSLSWYQRPLKLFTRKERIAGRDTYSKEKFYAENAFINGLWVSETACTFKHAGTEWVHKGKPDQQAKYGFAVGHITSPELSLHSTDDGQLHEWLGRRQCLPVSISDIRAYCQHEAVVAARERGETADLSFHRFLAMRAGGFCEQGQAVFQSDISELDLRSCDFSGVNFSGATLAGDLSNSCFDRALLYGVTGVRLKSEAGSRVSFVNAELGFSTLAEADFQGQVDMTQANLSCCNLTNTKFGQLLHVGAVWHKALLVGTAYDGLAEEQRAQVAALEEKQVQQFAEFNSLNDKVVALEAQIKPLLASLASDAPPAAGAGGPASPESTASSQRREQLEALLLAQEKHLQFEAYCRSKLAQLSIASGRHAEQIAFLEDNLDRIEKQSAQADTELQSQIDALSDRVGKVEGYVAAVKADHGLLIGRTSVIALDVKVNAARLSELRGLVDELGKMSLSSEMPAEAREAYLEKQAIGKVLDEYVVQLSQREQDLHFYVRPDVVESVPGNKSPGEYMLAIEEGDSSDSVVPLMDEMNAYLESRDEVMLLLGEPGGGKSLFAWYSTQSRLAAYKELLQGLEPTETPWLPVVIELKHYRLSELEGLLPTILKKTCRLHDDELKAIQNDNKPAHRLLVVLDGFDELNQAAGGEVDIKKEFKDIYAACGTGGWHAGQVKLIVTCRFRELPDRYLEQQYFGQGEAKQYRRRILLPFSQTKIGEYLAERTQGSASSEFELLPVEDYQAVLETSSAVKEMVRNPFVLRLFVEALPGIHKSGVEIEQIKRYDIYQGFVQQWFEREVLKLEAHWQRKLGVGKIGVKAVAQRFELFASVLANEMYRHNSLVVDINAVDRKDDAFMVWAGFERQLLIQIKLKAEATLRARYQALGAFELDELEDEGITNEQEYVSKYLVEEKRRQRAWDKTGLVAFRRTSPLRQAGGHYSFIHKSFYEYFIARGLLQQAGDKKPVKERMREMLAHLSAVAGHESRRLWQEPEALDFVCEFWSKASREEKDGLKETWLAVIEATKGHPEHGAAGGNVITLLNWVNVNMIYKHWQGVHIPGADLRNAYLEGSDLSGADLSGAWLGRIQANQVDLRWANLTKVEFSERPAVSLEYRCNAIAYHPTKNRVAVAKGKHVRQYDFAENLWLESLLVGHTDDVLSVSYSVDGKWLATGSYDKTIRQWDAVRGEARGAPLKGHTGPVTSVSYSADGEWLASGSRDKTIRRWSAVSGEMRGAPLKGHTDRVTSVSYSADGKWLASGSDDGTIRQWAAASGALRGAPLVGHAGPVASVSYSGDGEWLASGSWDKTIRQWAAASGALRGVPLEGHTDRVTSVSYSGDGEWLASGSYDGTIRQWTAASGALRGAPLVGHTGPVTSVRYSCNEWLASGSYDGTIRQWAAASGALRGAPLKGHTDTVNSVSYSRDGEWLASGSDDGTIRQWRAASGALRGASLKGHTDRVTSVSYSGDGEWLASGSDDGTIQQWRAASGQLQGALLKRHTDRFASVSYSRDGEWLASGSVDCTIRQWSLVSGEMRVPPLEGHTGPVTSVSYSDDGEWLASGSYDGTIRQWVAASGVLRGAPLKGHTDTVNSVSYSRDGEWLASGSDDGTIRQWRAASGVLRGAPLEGHTDWVRGVSYSVDGEWLASGSRDCTIRQWAAASGELRGAPLEGHTDEVSSVSYSPDGQWLASGSGDGTVRVWRRGVESTGGCVSDESMRSEVWRLAWGSKSNRMQLSASRMKLAGVIGLEPHQLQLLRQHGYDGKINAETGRIEDAGADDEARLLDSGHSEGALPASAVECKASEGETPAVRTLPAEPTEVDEEKAPELPASPPLLAPAQAEQFTQLGLFAPHTAPAIASPRENRVSSRELGAQADPHSKGCGKCHIQ